jgi:hypothetical protein
MRVISPKDIASQLLCRAVSDLLSFHVQKEREKRSPVKPLMLAFFFFVVVGSCAFLAILRLMTQLCTRVVPSSGQCGRVQALEPHRSPP